MHGHSFYIREVAIRADGHWPEERRRQTEQGLVEGRRTTTSPKTATFELNQLYEHYKRRFDRPVTYFIFARLYSPFSEAIILTYLL